MVISEHIEMLIVNRFRSYVDIGLAIGISQYRKSNID